MARETEEALRARILLEVRALLESDGYDAVQLREVARRAHVSLTTIYKLFPTRDDLLVSAIEAWMEDNTYIPMKPPPPGESIHDGLIRVIRHVFDPWERHPIMLEAYHRARTGPASQRLDNHGLDAVIPVVSAVLAGATPRYLEDIAVILSNMTFSLLGQCADGTLQVSQVLPILERTVHRLTANNEPEATEALRCRDSSDPLPLAPDAAVPYRRTPTDSPAPEQP
ncbi:TetR/AcrR family transcriptional regulator [Nocardia aurantiaca]|uniref:TetR family transcriptional regulator n=1 Tax=Nocardia aurantiaca TaxID=2675850 RepID=A0A6I3L202_9NOCA|nr:TetR/AcrR family transcriptional regulator [Nocardia aurantiaca]MTE15847.1 TetR family transcriptional regulator [Nocardia aurantiaca]